MSKSRFADSGDILDQKMPACEQTHDRPLDHLGLSLHDTLDVRLEQSYLMRHVQSDRF
jgi:hypothetical protein